MITEQEICKNLLNRLSELLDDLNYLQNNLTKKAGYSPLTQAIKNLCELDFRDFSSTPNTGSYLEVQKEAFFLRQKHWIIGLLWVLKLQTKVFRKSEYPYNHPYFRLWEPFGKIINSEIELWSGCLDFIDTHGYPLLSTQKTSIDGFYNTTYEKILGCCKSMNFIITKEENLKAQLEELKLLKNDENPYDYNEPDERNLYNLIDLAVNIKKRQLKDNNTLKTAKTGFINSYWNPYIKAHKDWYATCKTTKELKMTCIKDDKLKIIVNGKQMVTLFPLSTNFLKQERTKKTLTIGSVQSFQTFAPQMGGDNSVK
jgi:hypothetical protein